MKKITIVINTVNDAFNGRELFETAEILNWLATNFNAGFESNALCDHNGNVVGSVTYE